MLSPQQIQLSRQSQFRIIPSVYPPVNFFEDLVDPVEMETLWELEALTNDRLRDETGDIRLVAPEDRVSGPGSSVVMAAFTHIHYPSRFSTGDFGVYYAGLSLETAIRETVYHRERFLQATQEQAGEICMRLYEGHIMKPLHDIRAAAYQQCHSSDDYSVSQSLGYELKISGSWGLIYYSVRHEGGECVAIFRPPAISIPQQTAHLRYIWNGHRITEVLGIQSIFDFHLGLGIRYPQSKNHDPVLVRNT